MFSSPSWMTGWPIAISPNPYESYHWCSLQQSEDCLLQGHHSGLRQNGPLNDRVEHDSQISKAGGYSSSIQSVFCPFPLIKLCQRTASWGAAAKKLWSSDSALSTAKPSINKRLSHGGPVLKGPSWLSGWWMHHCKLPQHSVRCSYPTIFAREITEEQRILDVSCPWSVCGPGTLLSKQVVIPPVELS